MFIRTRNKLGSMMALVLVSALAFAGCGSNSSDAPAGQIKPTFVVKDTSAAVVAGATVYAIPVADVEALAAVALDSTATATTGNYSAEALAADEPLEDLIAANSGTYVSAVTDTAGKAVFADNLVVSDRFFIAVKPGTADHLPGGSICREAKAGSTLNNVSTDIVVSTTPSSSATFVGTSQCLGCHSGYATMKKTMHKLGFMAPNAPSGLQDRSEFDANDGIYNMSAGLEKYTAGDAASGGTTIYFYDYDSTRKFDKFKTLESAPTGTVYATVRVYQDTTDNKYKAQFTNVINPSDPNSGMIHEAVLTYGGGVYKQRNITKIDDSLFMIPLQFNQQGSDASADRTRKVWRDYHMDWWVSSIVSNVSMTFKAKPAASASVDVQCAACHFNGYKLTASPTFAGYYTAEGVADANGELHPVTGVNQELNIGCETCHGPGSEHVAAGGNGKFIVTPANITPERSNMICGQCHSRPQGNGTFKNDSPLSSSNKMMIAGTSRADFLANQTSRHDAAVGDFWGDKLHSKSHHQQYTDFIKTAKYRNGTSLKTCASCHTPHGPGTGVRHQLKGTTSDNSLCASCHSTVVLASHMEAKTGTASMPASTQCIQCHMPKTSSSGAGSNATSPFVGDSATKYFTGDINSHLLDVPLKTSISSTNTMPVAYTDSCGFCHSQKSTL